MHSTLKLTRIKFTMFLLVVAILYSCIPSKKQKPSAEVSNGRTVSANAIFDGKTLDGWKITEYGTQGPVLVNGGKIILNYGDGCTGITYQRDFPTMNYEVVAEARKTSGNDFFCGMTFPVNEEFCSLIVGGWGGPVVGLSNIDGKDAAHNATKTLKRFDRDVWYRIRLRVSPQKIEAWVDDKQVVNFDYHGHKLSIRPEVSLAKPFGICSWNTTAELRAIELVHL